MVVSNVLSLLRHVARFKAYRNMERDNTMERALENNYGMIVVSNNRDIRGVERKHTYDCLAIIATTSDVTLAKICMDMI